mgnify:CR=1 FL=1
MKNFQQYLAESERTYNYRIKIVGDVAPDFIKMLEEKCKQFDIVSFGKPKSTPVQLRPADFPKHSNDSVTSIDVEFRYPAIEPQIKQLAQLLMIDPNRIIMLTTPHEEGMDSERERVAAQNKNLLDTDYPADTPEQLALKADYSAPYDQECIPQ